MNCNPSSPVARYAVTEATAQSVAAELTGEPATVKKLSRTHCRIRAKVGGKTLAFNGRDWFMALLALKTQLSRQKQHERIDDTAAIS